MKRRVFTPEERSELEQNPNILKVLSSNVEFKEEFKRKALKEHDEEGKPCRQIFKEAGVPDWLNVVDYAKSNIKRWRNRFKCKELQRRGRPKVVNEEKPISEMSLEELRKYVAYLELENEFLKKLEPLEQYKTKN